MLWCQVHVRLQTSSFSVGHVPALGRPPLAVAAWAVWLLNRGLGDALLTCLISGRVPEATTSPEKRVRRNL